MVTTEKTYKELLKDDRWKSKRVEIIRRDGFKCVCCGGEFNIEVHHRQYHISKVSGEFVLPWNYDERYLISLCNKCHDIGHKMYKVPTFKV